jgi:hypothetical protein
MRNGCKKKIKLFVFCQNVKNLLAFCNESVTVCVTQKNAKKNNLGIFFVTIL